MVISTGITSIANVAVNGKRFAESRFASFVVCKEMIIESAKRFNHLNASKYFGSIGA